MNSPDLMLKYTFQNKKSSKKGEETEETISLEIVDEKQSPQVIIHLLYISSSIVTEKNITLQPHNLIKNKKQIRLNLQ